MDTRWLHDFLTLVEVRNFTRAADLRNLSQAAFSRRIQNLEHWLGTKLIDRNAFPVQLTEAGERFCNAAAVLDQQLTEIRAELGGIPASNQIRLAAPWALATTQLPRWWKKWDTNQNYSVNLLTGNVHDTVTAFSAGAIDLLVCYHQENQPLPLDTTHYDCLTLGTDTVRPYAAVALVRDGSLKLPGSEDCPVPLLMYSPSVYFARLIDASIARAPQALYGRRIFEAEMSDVLRDLAIQGLGVAWLADSAVTNCTLGRGLAPLESRDWDVEVSILAWRQKHRRRTIVDTLWRRIQDECSMLK